MQAFASRERFAIAALRRAWGIACDMKERSLAEYISTSLSRTCPPTRRLNTPKRLQNLALDKLSEFGISRADLEGVADMISGGNRPKRAHYGHFAHHVDAYSGRYWCRFCRRFRRAAPDDRFGRRAQGCAFEGRANAALFRFGGLRQALSKTLARARVGR